MPTQTKENYLKTIFNLTQVDSDISITKLAESMEVSKPTVHSMVKKMHENGWLLYTKYKPLTLTQLGATKAALIVRKHRLAEMFLAKIMNFGWEEVHAIAEELEHVKSEHFFDRMDEILGFPSHDPHGSPIPDKKGYIVKPNLVDLSSLNVGQHGIFSGINDSSRDLLMYLNKKNIQLHHELKVISKEAFDKSMEVIVDQNKTPITLSYEVSKCLLLKVID